MCIIKFIALVLVYKQEIGIFCITNKSVLIMKTELIWFDQQKTRYKNIRWIL